MIGRGVRIVQRMRRSPRWNAGSMLPERTTTIGEGESEMTESLGTGVISWVLSQLFGKAIGGSPFPHHECRRENQTFPQLSAYCVLWADRRVAYQM